MVTDSDPFVFRFLMNLSKKKKRHELVVFVLKVLLATVFVKLCSVLLTVDIGDIAPLQK